ncbi:MAG: TIGR04551 family protein [Deltaproteobacteria bacterium]|nr:TIGR04551 family protein [Deltaproteobacteria bacterium]
MRQPLALALTFALSASALAQTDGGQKAAPKPAKAAPAKAAAKPAVKKAPAKAATKPDAKAAAKADESAAAKDAADKDAAKADEKAAADKTAEAAATPPAVTPAPAPAAPPAAPAIDPEEFRQKVMEEVRKELQKAKDDVKRDTSWMEQDANARVQDSEAVEKLKSHVNLFQPHGYLRTRYEFFSNFDLDRGNDPSGYTLFPNGFIGTGGNNSQSGANFRFRFDPVMEVSEDLSIHATFDVLDNVLLGSNTHADPMLDPYTPIAALADTRASSAINVKRVWGRINTQVGELLVGRMGYHFGLGILHNDGNGLDQDFGDTYDRVAFSTKEIKGHKLGIRMDLLDKGATTTGEHGELGRSVDLDTLDDGYGVGIQVQRIDTPDELRRKLDAGELVFNYGATFDYRVQDWDTLSSSTSYVNGTSQGPATLGDFAALRQNVVPRKTHLYLPDVFLSIKRKRMRIELEVAGKMGKVGTRALNNVDLTTQSLAQPLTFFQVGGVLQSEFAFLPADALLTGVEVGMASGDKGAYGFGARPWRSGSGHPQGYDSQGNIFRAAGPGDIDGPHFDFNTNNPNSIRGHVNNFVFNRAYSTDMILYRNIISSVTSSWYVKPSIRYRPTGRKTGGGDDSGFELTGAIIYSQAWYDENTPGLSKPLGLEGNVGISYDTTDHLHIGFQYGILLPFSGLQNTGIEAGGSSSGVTTSPSIAHAMRILMAIPF